MENESNVTKEVESQTKAVDSNANKQVKKVVKKKKVTKGKAVGFGILMLVIYLAVQMVVSIFGIIPMAMKAMLAAGGDMQKYQENYMNMVSNSSELITNLQAVGTLVCVIVFALWYYFGFYKKSKKSGEYESVAPKLLKAKSWVFILSLEIFVLAASVLLSVLSRKLMPGVDSWLNNIMSLAIGGNDLIGIISVAVFAPIAEELLVRGIIMNYARKAYGIVGCIVLTTIMFSVIHMNPIQGLYVIPMGICWGYVGYKFKSVIPCIVLHMIQNTTSLVAGDLAIMDNYWFLTILFVVFGALMVFVGKRLDFEKEGM